MERQKEPQTRNEKKQTELGGTPREQGQENGGVGREGTYTDAPGTDQGHEIGRQPYPAQVPECHTSLRRNVATGRLHTLCQDSARLHYPLEQTRPCRFLLPFPIHAANLHLSVRRLGQPGMMVWWRFVTGFVTLAGANHRRTGSARRRKNPAALRVSRGTAGYGRACSVGFVGDNDGLAVDVVRVADGRGAASAMAVRDWFVGGDRV